MSAEEPGLHLSEKRAELNIQKAQEHLNALVEECPEFKDLVLVINWQQPREDLPICVVASGERDASEVVQQSVELTEKMLSAAAQLSKNIIQKLVTTINEMK